MKDKLLKHRDAAEMLGVSPRTLYNLVSEKVIDVVKLNGRINRYRLSVLEKLINDKTQIAQKSRP